MKPPVAIALIAAVPCLLIIVRWFDGGFGGLLSPTWPAMLGRGLLNFSAYTAYYLALAALPMVHKYIKKIGRAHV